MIVTCAHVSYLSTFYKPLEDKFYVYFILELLLIDSTVSCIVDAQKEHIKYEAYTNVGYLY